MLDPPYALNFCFKSEVNFKQNQFKDIKVRLCIKNYNTNYNVSSYGVKFYILILP